VELVLADPDVLDPSKATERTKDVINVGNTGTGGGVDSDGSSYCSC